MRTIKLTMAIAALALSTVICQAQPHSGHPEKHNKGAKLVEKLGLSQEQADQLKVIHEKQMIENKALQGKMAPLKEELKKLKAQKKDLNDSKMKEIELILTPEQFIKFKELKANKKEHRQEKRQNH